MFRLLAKKIQPPFKPSVVRGVLRVDHCESNGKFRNLCWMLPTLIPILLTKRLKTLSSLILPYPRPFKISSEGSHTTRLTSTSAKVSAIQVQFNCTSILFLRLVHFTRLPFACIRHSDIPVCSTIYIFSRVIVNIYPYADLSFTKFIYWCCIPLLFCIKVRHHCPGSE
jgi:hypothetical protein